MLNCLASAIVYRNPSPHLKSRQAFHPSLLNLGDGAMLCSYDVGEAVESVDYRTYLSRSVNGGQDWESVGPLLSGENESTTHSVRLSQTADARVVGVGARFHRVDPCEGLVNRATSGFVPMELFLTESSDTGATWTRPRNLCPPLQNPAFEICHGIFETPMGRWLFPTSTARSWDGHLPAGEMAVVFLSDDQGVTWPVYGVTFDGSAKGIIHWEQSVVSLDDERLLSVSWAYDPAAGKTLPTPYTISKDGGLSFASERLTGLLAQTCKLLSLGDGRILAAYRRDDQPGLWATMASIDRCGGWKNHEHIPLWGTSLATPGMGGQPTTIDALSDLKFGYPSLTRLSDNEAMVAFWSLEGWTSVIRTYRVGF